MFGALRVSSCSVHSIMSSMFRSFMQLKFLCAQVLDYGFCIIIDFIGRYCD